MYSKILVALDGSRSSEAAALHALDLAKAVRAAVVAVHVAPPSVGHYFADAAPLPGNSKELWESGLRSVAERHFAAVRQAARSRAVPLVTEVMFDESPSEALGRAAVAHGCDLIVVGRNGGAARQRPLGEPAARLLASCRLPVLVHRAPLGLV